MVERNSPPEEESEFEQALRNLIKRSLTDGPPPRPVVRDEIQRLLNNELNESEKDDVLDLISSYQAWNDAYGEILKLRQSLRNQGRDAENPDQA